LIVMDTNVVSELMRAEPAEAVARWVGLQPAGELATTAVTVAEIGYGIQRLPAGRRRELLRAAAADVFDAFPDLVLPFDGAAASLYPGVVVERDSAGLPISGFDAQIAAICRSKGALLATRNTADFASLGLVLVNPWLDPAAS
jgi:toxin FitB